VKIQIQKILFISSVVMQGYGRNQNEAAGAEYQTQMYKSMFEEYREGSCLELKTSGDK